LTFESRFLGMEMSVVSPAVLQNVDKLMWLYIISQKGE